jgi:3-phenylpropionate/trans-cinnamate dioxygenase ferredoxin subunit
MSRWIDVGASDEVARGAMKEAKADGRELVLARVGDAYYAADGRCPHLGGRLWLGVLEGTVVTCPWHHSRFDLADGRNLRWTDWKGFKVAMAKVLRSPRPLKTYPVKVEAGRILIDLDETR